VPADQSIVLIGHFLSVIADVGHERDEHLQELLQAPIHKRDLQVALLPTLIL
jgi:hypothetical protein